MSTATVQPDPERKLKEIIMIMEKFIEKFAIPIVAALIGFAASVYAAQITAASTATSATAGVLDTATTNASSAARQATFAVVREQEQRTSGGTILADGRIANRIGRSYSVTKESTGRYRITFDQAFSKAPVALVAPYMQNVLTIARIVFTDERSVVVAITRVGEVTPED